MSDEMREKVARLLASWDTSAGEPITWEQWHEAAHEHFRRDADAILAVIDPNGLRAEAERLRGLAKAHRDAGIRTLGDLAALRAGVKALAQEGESWGHGVAVDLSRRLRALLEDGSN